MFLGHYGLALATKRAAPRVSLGWLAFAAEFLDELWPILLLAGVEQVRVVPGLLAANNLDFVSYPISHSLLTVIGWALVIGALYYSLRRERWGAAVVGALVLSHWVLDLPMHRPDLPLWPGSSTKVGFGLWNSMAATITIEMIFFLGGILIYVRSTRARDRVGTWGLWAMILLLLVFFAAGFADISASPPSERSIAVGALALWLFVPWSHWVDRHREFL